MSSETACVLVCDHACKRECGSFFFVLFAVLCPSQQLFSYRDGQFPYPHFFSGQASG